MFFPDLQPISMSISEKIFTKPKSDILIVSSLISKFSGWIDNWIPWGLDERRYSRRYFCNPRPSEWSISKLVPTLWCLCVKLIYLFPLLFCWDPFHSTPSKNNMPCSSPHYRLIWQYVDILTIFCETEITDTLTSLYVLNLFYNSSAYSYW